MYAITCLPVYNADLPLAICDRDDDSWWLDVADGVTRIYDSARKPGTALWAASRLERVLCPPKGIKLR
ncbi:uncharacterized protein N7479_011210 [Penicillium vulpinum]|uniref:uncharacterized protein n=1 Tax=Penicillium vulpinum TaxID=29845 RepID=UPI002548E146|nr:uncharacterized protein N7479_011210 [Penicillium vulpinum]KAJ5952797.1 hypothetical protein N7479_011210 [Penicillium vulpinum]